MSSQGVQGDTQAYLPSEDPRWSEAERALWWAISCRNFSKRQKRMLMFLLKESFGRCRGKAYVSSLESFDEYTGLGVTHSSEVLKVLKLSHVIAEYPEHCYGIRFPIENWKVEVLPERMYHDEQLALIHAPSDLVDALREVFIDDIKNLPARGPVRRAVHPDRSNPDLGPSQDKTGGVVSREPEGSVPGDQAEATGCPHDPQGGTPTSPEQTQTLKPQPFPDSGSFSRIGKRAEERFPNRETPQNPMATAKSAPFPESGSPRSTALMQECSNASKKQYCTDAREGPRFPESGNEPEVQQCSSAPAAGEGKTRKFTQDQQYLFDELEAIRGNGGKRLSVFGEKKEWFPFWVVSVRERFEVTKELLGELKYAMITRTIDDPGAWMMDKWKRWGKRSR